MNAMPFVIGTIAVFVIAYRLYFRFVAAIAGAGPLVGPVLARGL